MEREREREKKFPFRYWHFLSKRGIACAVRLERTASKLQCTKIQLLASGIVTAKKGIDITFCIQLCFFGGQKKKLWHMMHPIWVWLSFQLKLAKMTCQPNHQTKMQRLDFKTSKTRDQLLLDRNHMSFFISQSFSNSS